MAEKARLGISGGVGFLTLKGGTDEDIVSIGSVGPKWPAWGSVRVRRGGPNAVAGRLWVSAIAGGSGRLALTRPDGQLLVQIGATPIGSGMCSVYRDGQLWMSLDAETGQMTLWNAMGQQTVRIDSTSGTIFATNTTIQPI